MVPSEGIEYAPSTLCPLQEGGRQGDHDCRERDWERLGTATADPDSGIDKTFELWRCGRCAMAFTDPVVTPESAPQLYESRESHDFQGDDPPGVRQLKARAARRDLRRALRLASTPAPRSILDYGCGNGAFAVAAAAEHPGARVVATDYHPDVPPPVQAAGSAVTYVPYTGLDDVAGDFDVVLCRHVLEHTYDPAATLRHLGSLVAPDGAVIVEVPRYDSPLAGLWKDAYSGFYAPYHPIHFGLDAMANVAGAAGLALDGHEGVDMPMMGRSLQNRLDRPYGLGLFLAGVALHPLQVVAGRVSGREVALRVVLRRRP